MDIKLELRTANGKFKTFTQDFVPFKKRMEYLKNEAALLEKLEKNDEVERQIGLFDYQAEFVASLFEDKEVTKDAILNGLDTENSQSLSDIILHRVLGIPKLDASEGDEKKED